MPAHPIDFQIQAGFYSIPEFTEIFDEKTRISRWLKIEATLAEVQGELGIIPQKAAEEIVKKSRIENIDLSKLAGAYEKSRNSLLPVINALKDICDEGYCEFIHYGATTQDVLDTSQILEQKDALAVIYRDLKKLADDRQDPWPTGTAHDLWPQDIHLGSRDKAPYRKADSPGPATFLHTIKRRCRNHGRTRQPGTYSCRVMC
jgi:hypothetical protein